MIQGRQFENSPSGIYILQFIFETTLFQLAVTINVYGIKYSNLKFSADPFIKPFFKVAASRN